MLTRYEVRVDVPNPILPSANPTRKVEKADTRKEALEIVKSEADSWGNNASINVVEVKEKVVAQFVSKRVTSTSVIRKPMRKISPSS